MWHHRLLCTDHTWMEDPTWTPSPTFGFSRPADDRRQAGAVVGGREACLLQRLENGSCDVSDSATDYHRSHSAGGQEEHVLLDRSVSINDGRAMQRESRGSSECASTKHRSLRHGPMIYPPCIGRSFEYMELILGRAATRTVVSQLQPKVWRSVGRRCV